MHRFGPENSQRLVDEPFYVAFGSLFTGPFIVEKQRKN